MLTLIVLLAGAGVWLVAWGDRDDGLNESDAFACSDKGRLYWFELSGRFGKVKGKLHQQLILEEIGEDPVIKEKEYPLTGKKTEKEYEFLIKMNGKTVTFEAGFNGKDLSVKSEGESKTFKYMAVNREELEKYKQVLHQEFETAIYYAEVKEKNRKRTFFSDLEKVYGYLYSTENSPFQLFLKIDKGYPHGDEIDGSFLMMEVRGNEYVETEYLFNGITDGQMIQIAISKDGESKILNGDFIGASTGFNLSFWTTDQKLKFVAVTEEEFALKYKEFKTRIQK